jgi:pectate lyase
MTVKLSICGIAFSLALQLLACGEAQLVDDRQDLGATGDALEQGDAADNDILPEDFGLSSHDEGVPRGDSGPQPSRDCAGLKHGQVESRTRFEKSIVPFGENCKKQTQTRSCNNGKLSAWSGTYRAVSCKQGTPASCGSIKHGGTETRTRYEKSMVAYGASCKKQTQMRSCNNGKLSSWSGTYTASACRVAPWENLLSERIGFGRAAKGGSGGPLCDVTNLNDSGIGSLRSCAELSGARWIRFKVSGTITLRSDIRVASFKTIDGRGAKITIKRYGFAMVGVKHVIIHNLRFEDGSNSAEDAISMTRQAQHIWVDHVHLQDYPDGLLDITREATDITVSWCRFEEHNKVMLIGADSSQTQDKVIRVTLHHNYFRKTSQRHPLLRFGKVHAFNNYLHDWQIYGMVAQMGGQILSEHNIFQANAHPDRALLPFWDQPKAGHINSRTDWRLYGAKVIENKPNSVFEAKSYYRYSLDTADNRLLNDIKSDAGRRSSTRFPL